MAAKMSTTLKAKVYHLSLFFLAFMIAQSSQLNLTTCGSGSRRPEITDITVECGTDSISLAIIYCPVMYTGYNYSHLLLNHVDDPSCAGTLDETASPPVVRFTFALNNSASCASKFVTTSATGVGVFSDFSNIQTVNISGAVYSHDPTSGTVTYNAELKYFYSCAYPLEYLINNTQIDVSASSIAVRDKNGSFISTLTMELFSDVNYTSPLIMPSNGLELRTRIYVQVEATNLTEQYNVLLDRCYASISSDPTTNNYFNLFVSCSRDQMTLMHKNGQSQQAHFSFQAFRFVEQQNETVSTYYLHCITRLCDISSCSSFACPTSGRRRRDLRESEVKDGVSTSTTLSSTHPIVASAETSYASPQAASQSRDAAASSTGLKAAVGVLAVAGIVGIGMAAFFYRRRRYN